jgi:SAM-dependent methyltransferase
MAEFDLEGTFNEDYLHFYLGGLTEERNEAEAAEIVDTLKLHPGMRVLDAPCGHGRLTNLLAARGLSMVGADLTELFLDKARQDAAQLGVEVDYRRLDVREMAFKREFDAAFSWFTSFGYNDDDTDRDILARYHAALKPEARFLMETQSIYRLVPLLIDGHGTSTHSDRVGDDLTVDTTTLDAVASRTHTQRILVRAGQVRATEFGVRLWSAPELTSWLESAGFREVRITDRRGEPFTVQSHRMVAVATA